MANQSQGMHGAGGKRLRDVMTHNPAFLTDDATIQRAAQMMNDLNIGALPVCEDGKLIGMLTDRDITVRCVAAGKDPGSTRVTDAMSASVECCGEDATTDEACTRMAALQIRRLPVIDKAKHLVGVVSLGDLAVKCDDTDGAAHALHDVSEPARPNKR